MFFCRQKFNFILHVFLEILQRYCELVILGTFGMSGYAHPKWYYQLVENFDFFLHAENELHHFFSILRNYILKNLIYWLDDSILAYNSRTWRLSDMGWWWNINKNISFHFKLFPGKTNNNFFSKNPKGPILRFFFPKVGQNSIFLEKRALSDFNIPIIYHHAKTQKKITTPFLMPDSGHKFQKTGIESWLIIGINLALITNGESLIYPSIKSWNNPGDTSLPGNCASVQIPHPSLWVAWNPNKTKTNHHWLNHLQTLHTH